MVRVEVAAPRGSRNHRSSVKRNAPAQIHPAHNHEVPGLRERKKARLRQQIIDTAVRLFRKQGYEKTRVDDIVKILEISQPTFFRYFPSKDAVLRDVGKLGFECVAEHLKSELSTKADTTERLRRLYRAMALILAQGQERGEITSAFPVVHLAEFMGALYHTVVRQWTVDLTGPHKLTERVDSAVEFFLRGVKP